MRRLKKILLKILVGLGIIYLLLLIPDSKQPAGSPAPQEPFVWQQDARWSKLEQQFDKALTQPPVVIDSAVAILMQQQQQLLQQLALQPLPATDSGWLQLLNNYFEMAPLVAARPVHRDTFLACYNTTRNLVKQQSQYWDINQKNIRNTLYQLLYGMRAATEEVLLQTDTLPYAPVLNVTATPALSPATNLLGIQVHSGDLLVSRGGAPVSALISRGNNYPGNFSHVALIYVDEKNTAYLVEAHIEKGVAIASAQQYVQDKKLRFMVLRPRADLPAIKANPLLPHQAAKFAYDAAQQRHIPYDFKMDFYDSSALFCSEVASYAYKKQGIHLWQAVSSISSQGVVNWLSNFGVTHFVTQMPSDLEYDPQQSVVAEWRDPETLQNDHLDNAVMDALLLQADKGKTIGYNHWLLPPVRILKGYCMLLNLFGKPGIIPEGMSATRALKNQTFVAMYNRVKNQTQVLVNAFIQQHHYYPPYWQLLALANTAAGS
jgi:hypothetical protein